MSELKLSYSRYWMYKLCPEAYRLQYIAHQPRREDRKNYLLGSTVHKAIEHWWKLETFKQIDLLAIYGDVFEQECKGIFWRLGEWRTFWDKGLVFLDKYYHILLKENLLGPHVINEYTFTQPVDGLLLHGIVDLIRKEPKVDIFDGKTGSGFLDVDQLTFYCLGTEPKFGLASDVGYIVIPDEKVALKEITEKMKSDLLCALHQMVKNIEQGTFETKESKNNCWMCGYSGTCKSSRC